MKKVLKIVGIIAAIAAAAAAVYVVIEKIKGSRVKPEIENTIHSVGFILLMILMIVVSWNDILRIFS